MGTYKNTNMCALRPPSNTLLSTQWNTQTCVRLPLATNRNRYSSMSRRKASACSYCRVKEGDNAVWCVAFNFVDVEHRDLFASVSKNKVHQQYPEMGSSGHVTLLRCVTLHAAHVQHLCWRCAGEYLQM